MSNMESLTTNKQSNYLEDSLKFNKHSPENIFIDLMIK